MGKFKRGAVAQVVDRGYAVSAVADWPRVSAKSIYTCKAQFAKPAKVQEAEADLVAELRPIKKELTRVTEERDTFIRGGSEKQSERLFSDKGVESDGPYFRETPTLLRTFQV